MCFLIGDCTTIGVYPSNNFHAPVVKFFLTEEKLVAYSKITLILANYLSIFFALASSDTLEEQVRLND